MINGLVITDPYKWDILGLKKPTDPNHQSTLSLHYMQCVIRRVLAKWLGCF